LKPDELLSQMSTAFRHQIGPAVVEPFAKTQAFMASVVLEKLSKQVKLAGAHALADCVALREDLEAMLSVAAPTDLSKAVAALAHGDAALAPLVAALYSHREQLGEDGFTAALDRVRVTLRTRLDRQLEVAT
jgi:hypothetical protein